MRAMLAERRETLRQYHQELQRLLTPELQAKLGVGSVAQVQSKHAHAERMAEELDTARTNYVDAVDNVLSWAEQQGDTIKLQEGQILWDSQAQIERYKSLFSKVLAAAADESRLYDEMTPVYQQ